MDTSTDNSLIESCIHIFNNNKYIYGVLMLLMNIGSRYIDFNLPTTHKIFLNSKPIQYLLLFTMAFIATRDVIISLLLTTSFVILIFHLVHPKSQYCILPKSFIELDTDGDGQISPEEIKKAYDTLKKAGKL